VSNRRVFQVGDPDVNAYRLLTALVVPRPIAWVSSLDTEGVGNLSPHSFFTVASARPPIVQFTSVGTKDTLRNVVATGEFVVNLVGRANLLAANASSARFEPGVDEAASLDIAMEPSELVRPLRVAASPASLECTLHSTIDLGESTVVLGDVVAITVDEAMLDGVHPVIERLQPLSRLGRDQWGLPPEVFAIDRPTEPGQVPEPRTGAPE
jgi:flavin reductase (DIM6/NTAB) family NADH-FMN oxidoreductase RutF